MGEDANPFKSELRDGLDLRRGVCVRGSDSQSSTLPRAPETIMVLAGATGPVYMCVVGKGGGYACVPPGFYFCGE